MAKKIRVRGGRGGGWLLGAFLLCLGAPRAFGFAGGDGSVGYPYQIATRQHLEAVNLDLAAHYVLANDLDLAGTNYPSAVIAPYSDTNSPAFSGSFDGNEKSIRNLRIEAAIDDVCIGLFGQIAAGGSVSNLALDGVDVGGGHHVGGLVGWNEGAIAACRASGEVRGFWNVAVLAGLNRGSISGSHAAGTVTSDYRPAVLVGWNGGAIANCHALGEASGWWQAGGLVGVNTGLLTRCYAYAKAGAAIAAGGLVGHNAHGTIRDCHAIGPVQGWDELGGLVGRNETGTIRDCYATGTVRHPWGGSVGGLVGLSMEGSTIRDCYATGPVEGGDSSVGGLVGRNSRSAVIRCYAVGAVTGTSDIGGLVGSKEEGDGHADEDNFWNEDTSLQTASAMGTGRNTAQMQNPSTFANWDFSDVWWMPTAGYPKLAWQQVFTEGDGSAPDPYRIYTQDQLEAVNDDLTAHYRLMNDLDLAGTVYDRAVIAPYVTGSSPLFTGSFDGNGKAIRNLRIEGGSNDYLGLFGQIGSGGQVTNLELAEADVSGFGYVGILAGLSDGGAAAGCLVGGTLHNTGSFTGGLIGMIRNGATVTDCRSVGTVTGIESVGGLVGDNDGAIATSCSLAHAVATGNYTGGLVGDNWGSISDSYARGAVTGKEHAGGLVGRHAAATAAALARCYATGAVNGTSDVGGLVGSKVPAGDPLNSFWDTNTTLQATSAMGQGRSTGDLYLEGTFTGAGWSFPTPWRMPAAGYPKLAWQAAFTEGNGEETNPYRIYTQDQLEAVNDDLAAHYRLMNDLDLVGFYPRAVIAPYMSSTSPRFTGSFDGNNRTIRNLMIHDGTVGYVGLFGRIGADAGVRRLRLEVDISAGSIVGGLAGVNDGAVTDCRVEGSVIGAGDTVGGLIGWNNGPVEQCHGAALVHGRGSVGGLVGANRGTLSRCQSRREVSGTAAFVGGLVGSNTGTINASFARGDVAGTDNIVGGLAGVNSEGGTIADCYARGAVHGAHHIGGLVGRNAESVIMRCFSTGLVTGTSNLGGLVGSILAGGSYADTDNYWDENTSVLATSAMGTPKDTAAMKTQSTFANWNFVFVWGLDGERNDGYPHLQQNLPARVVRPAFNPPGGVFPGGLLAVDVMVSCFTPNAWIHCTTDGSEPTDVDPAHTSGGAVPVTLPATLKARAYAAGTGLEPSATHSAFYDGRTAGGVHFSWLLTRGFTLDGSDDNSVPPGKTQDVRTHFLADLDPENPDSVFRILSLERSSPVRVQFEPSSSNRVYRLEYRDSLAEGGWQPVSGAQWRPGSVTDGSLWDMDAGVSNRFYRVTVEMPGVGNSLD